jgi:hypothetical protein
MADDYAGRTAQLANSPLQQRYVANYMGNMPGYGTMFGTTHLNEAIAPRVPAGSARPLAPGEYNQNPGGGWSSEISLTVPHPTKPGKWTNIPSVWLVGGVPKRLTQEQAIEAARQSGLDWPEFDTSQVADQSATDRETNWGNLGPSDAAQAPPLWNRR